MSQVIHVIIEKGESAHNAYKFTRPFQIGRASHCDIQILEDDVSRHHASIEMRKEQWWIVDLGSSNGVWINGRRVDQAPISDNTVIELSPGGTRFTIRSPVDAVGPQPKEAPSSVKDDHKVEHYARHYFGDAREQGIGERTMMVRQAFQKIQRKQKRTFIWVVIVSVCICLLSGTYAVLKHLEVEKQKKLAEEIFYTMKSLELEFADVLALARRSKDEETIKTVEKFKTKYKVLEKNYDKFVDSLNIYGKGVDEKDKLILKVARTFGECEIIMPEAFKNEVMNYIGKWRSTSRLANALRRAHQNDYVSTIVETMQRYDLPPHFFYLGLQESNFDVYACGPETRYGIAKGMWQFIPSTAAEYGLDIGPLAHLRKPDELDERHDFEKSTQAAGKYLRHIYDTDAQASGLLVIASYNWGEGRVNRLIKQMPKNPAERNFWHFLENNRSKIPKETYDYVFYIFSAAVIGENPDLFGFDFTNPLQL